MDYQIIKQGENQYIEYIVEAGSEIDTIAQGMLINNEISGLLPLNVIEKDGLIDYSYEITGLQKVSDIYEKTFLKQGLLTLLISIAEIVIKSRDYMILEKSLEFEPDKMYFDFSTGKPHLLCVPFKRNDEEICSFRSSIIEILKNCRVAKNESPAFIPFLINYLNQEERTVDQTLDFFQRVLNNDIIIPKIKSEKQQAGEKQAVRKNEDSIKTLASLKESAKKETAVKSIMPKKTSSGIRTLEELLLARKEAGKVEDGELRKGSAIPLEEGEELAEVYEETGLLEDYQPQNNELATSPKQSAYLIRLSNQKKILINTREFVIGRSEEQADYAIVDNKWISNVHCSIISTQDGCYVRDLGSMNHTYLNDNLISTRKEVLIPDNAIIRLGNERFRFKYS